ncbi:MAG: sigma-70 family RNA polymerase sigma factor [Deltaproteobacteria bacterium]|nr:MAG: sigma-70 family RNA polymerase sigma factor [Deltaproteobacteria bacterium]
MDRRGPHGIGIASPLRCTQAIDVSPAALTALRDAAPLDHVDIAARNVTTLLRAWGQQGDHAAFDKIWPLIYDELQRLAVRLLRRESGPTLAPTDLIHEAYLRLAGGVQLEFKDRVHFFAIAARCMRQILVDRARRRRADKRGSGDRPIALDENCIAIGRSWDLVALDDALEELAKHSERKARVVELYYFGGLTQEEIAAVCDVHVNTVARDLHFSEAWLRRHLAG